MSSITDFCHIHHPLAAYRLHDSNSINDLQRELDGSHAIWAKHLAGDDCDTQQTRVLSEIMMYARLGVAASSRGLSSADEWLSRAGDMAQTYSKTDFLAYHISRYAQDTPKHNICDIQASSDVLKSACAKAGLVDSVALCVRDYWYRFIHGSYQLRDYGLALQCIMELLKRCGMRSTDRGIRGIAARSLVGFVGHAHRNSVLQIERDLVRALSDQVGVAG